MSDLFVQMATNLVARTVAPVMAVVEFITTGDVSEETSDALIKGLVGPAPLDCDD